MPFRFSSSQAVHHAAGVRAAARELDENRACRYLQSRLRQPLLSGIQDKFTPLSRWA